MYKEAEVRRGIAWMDVNKPGWRENIDWDGLNMKTCTDCILAQIFGSYTDIVGFPSEDGKCLTSLMAMERGLTLQGTHSAVHWRLLAGTWHTLAIETMTKREQNENTIHDDNSTGLDDAGRKHIRATRVNSV